MTRCECLKEFMESDHWTWREEAVLCAINLATTPWWDVRTFWSTLRVARAASKSWMEGRPAGFKIVEGSVRTSLPDYLSRPKRIDG